MSNVNTCRGSVITAKTLEVKFKGKSIADVLESDRPKMRRVSFRAVPAIRERWNALMRVALVHQVGQQATTRQAAKRSASSCQKSLSNALRAGTL